MCSLRHTTYFFLFTTPSCLLNEGYYRSVGLAESLSIKHKEIHKKEVKMELSFEVGDAVENEEKREGTSCWVSLLISRGIPSRTALKAMVLDGM